MGLVQKRRRRS